MQNFRTKKADIMVGIRQATPIWRVGPVCLRQANKSKCRAKIRQFSAKCHAGCKPSFTSVDKNCCILPSPKAFLRKILPTLKLLENIPLKDYTTIGTGGSARYFLECASDDELRQALSFAKTRNLDVFILGGGSNLLASDEGYPGLVIKVATENVSIKTDGTVVASAGVNWSSLVTECCRRGLAGIETLAGIPGLVGATPIQNVGAYGQEVANVITEVHAIEKSTLRSTTFSNQDCNFGYRNSRFKADDCNKFIITSVVFKLSPSERHAPSYEELRRALDADPRWKTGSREEQILLAREHVLNIRKSKGMVLDPNDPDTRSVGSFFINPVVSTVVKESIARIASSESSKRPFVAHPTGTDHWKISAAWLIESAGIKKGQSLGRARVSSKHVLALTNPGQATTREILDLAHFITKTVEERYGIRLEREPTLLTSSEPSA